MSRILVSIPSISGKTADAGSTSIASDFIVSIPSISGKTADRTQTAHRSNFPVSIPSISGKTADLTSKQLMAALLGLNPFNIRENCRPMPKYQPSANSGLNPFNIRENCRLKNPCLKVPEDKSQSLQYQGKLQTKVGRRNGSNACVSIPSISGKTADQIDLGTNDWQSVSIPSISGKTADTSSHTTSCGIQSLNPFNIRENCRLCELKLKMSKLESQSLQYQGKLQT